MTTTGGSFAPATVSAPDNDGIANYATVTTMPFFKTEDTSGATLENGEPQPCGQIGATVWFAFSSAEDTELTVSTSGFDTAVAVYTGPPGSFSSLQFMGCNSSGPEAQVTFAVHKAGIYWVQAGGQSGGSGQLDFRISYAGGALRPPTQVAGFPPGAQARASSNQVVLVPNPYGSACCAGRMPTSGVVPGTDLSFNRFAFRSVAVGDIDPPHLANADTVVLVQVNEYMLDFDARETLDAFVTGGGKLIIYDSDGTAFNDYAWLPAAAQSASSCINCGAYGGSATLTENNTMVSNEPFTDQYIDLDSLARYSDAIGDANVLLTQDSNWYVDVRATNSLGSVGAVHTYASAGAGLMIYNGFDTDSINEQLPGVDHVGSAAWLAKLWYNELAQPWDPDGLPRGTPVNQTVTHPVVYLHGLAEPRNREIDGKVPFDQVIGQADREFSGVIHPFAYYEDAADLQADGSCASRPAPDEDPSTGIPNLGDPTPTVCDSESDVGQNAALLDADVRNLYQQSGGRKVILVGYSMGASIIRGFLVYSQAVGDGVADTMVDSVFFIHGAQQGSALANYAEEDMQNSQFGQWLQQEAHNGLGLNFDRPALYDLETRSQWLRWVNPRSTNLPDIPYYNTIGDIQIFQNKCTFFVFSCHQVQIASAGDGVLSLGSDDPTALPASGGQRFLPNGQRSTQTWEWTATDRIEWHAITDPFEAYAMAQIFTSPIEHTNIESRMGETTVEDCEIPGTAINQSDEIYDALQARITDQHFDCES